MRAARLSHFRATSYPELTQAYVPVKHTPVVSTPRYRWVPDHDRALQAAAKALDSTALQAGGSREHTPQVKGVSATILKGWRKEQALRTRRLKAKLQAFQADGSVTTTVLHKALGI